MKNVILISASCLFFASSMAYSDEIVSACHLPDENVTIESYLAGKSEDLVRGYKDGYETEISAYINRNAGYKNMTKLNSYFKDSLAGKKLGYQKGSKIILENVPGLDNYGWYELGNAGSWSYAGASFVYGYYNVSLEMVKKFVDSYSDDGTVSFKYNSSNNTIIIERIKNAPSDTQSAFAFSSIYKYISGQFFWQDINTPIKPLPPKTKKYTPSNLNKDQTMEYRNSKGNIVSFWSYLTPEDSPTIDISAKKDSFEIPKTLPSTPEIYLNITNKMIGGELRYEWIDRPDITNEGIQKIRVRVTDKLDDYVHAKEIILNFTSQSIKAEASLQEFVLGTKINDFSNFIKNVKYGETTLNPDQYSVNLVGSISTETIGEKNAKIQVTLKSDNSKKLDIYVPYKVKWGNSVVYGSYDHEGNGRTSAAFTLSFGKSPAITSSEGDKNDNTPIHEAFGDDKYYGFDLFNMFDKDTLLVSDSDTGDKSLSAKGSDLKQDTLRKWGTNQVQSVNYGDLVRAFQVEPDKNWLYEDEEKRGYNEGKNSVYYEITSKGYRPLHFNQLNPTVGIVPMYSSHKYFDDWLSFFLKNDGYETVTVKGFTKYPDTTTSGDKQAKIRVEEKLSNGKVINYDYEVKIIVKEGELKLNSPATITFNDFSKSKSEQTIQRTEFGNLGLNISDNRGQGKQGNWRLTAQVNKIDELAPYLIFRDGISQDKYLNLGATEIYSQEKQSNSIEPLNVNVSGQWTKDTGILLKVPSKNNLSSKQYSSKITWNLVEGP